jgi:hypothetical protein
MQNYQPLNKLAEGLWIQDGEWYGTAFRRRMTVLGLKDGGILIHNPFELKEDDAVRLEGLGRIAGIIMPNAFHGDDLAWMAKRFSKARVFIPGKLKLKLEKVHRVDGLLEKDWPNDWSHDVACISIEGMRILHESVFVHFASKTLVVTDLVFHMQATDFKTSIERKLMSWNRVGVGFGPSRLCDTVFTRDLKARRHSVERILQLDFDRVIMNHGHLVHQGGKEMVRSAFGEYCSNPCH